MKKGLLIAIAALFVAAGVNAQAVRTASQVKNVTLETVQQAKKVTKTTMATPAQTNAAANLTMKKAPRKAAAGDIVGTYILDQQNLNRNFTTSSEFTITAESGKVNVGDFDEEDNFVETREFEYNVVIKDFGTSGSVAYGLFEDDELWIPMQTVAEDNDEEDPFGRIVLSALTVLESGAANYGGDLVFSLDDEGNLLYESEADGYGMFGPDELSQYFWWGFGFDIEVLLPNGIMVSRETHVVNGAWSAWTPTNHNVYLEKYNDEVVVHNFFGIRPVSIAKSGDEYSLMLPIEMGTYEYPTYGRMQVWIENEDATSENDQLTNEGQVVGYDLNEDGYKGIRFWATEYREAWTDENGEHEAGDYYTYRPYFYIGAIDGSGYGYWWGEATALTIYDLSETEGINDVTTDNAAGKSTKTFNLMGQQVKNVKGLVIRDGKKFVNK